MSQRAVFVSVNGNRVDEMFSSIPTEEDAIQICIDEGYEPGDTVIVESEWIEIGDGESDTDNFIPEESLINLHKIFYDYKEFIEEKYGYNVETIQTNEIEICLKEE